MAMSTADYFRMMQGGVDRTGYANMMPDRIENRESIDDRLAKLMEADTAEDDIPPEETGGETGGDTIGSILKETFIDPFTSVDDSTGKVTDQSQGQAILNTGLTGVAFAPMIKRALVGGKGNPYRTLAFLAPELLYMGGQEFAPETTKKVEEYVGGTLKPAYDEYVDPFLQKHTPIGGFGLFAPAKEAASNLFNELGEYSKNKKQIFEDDLIAQGANPESRFFDSAVQGGSMTADDLSEYEQNMDALSNLLNLGTDDYNDGGRVGFSVGGQSPRGGLRGGRRSGFGGTPDPGGGPGGGPDNNKNDLMGPGLDAPTIDPMKAVGYTPVKQPSLIDQVKKYNFLQGVYGDEDDGLSFGYDINPYAEEASAKLSYSFADGGRVGLQNGGLPPLPSLPQYTQPTFGYDTIFPGEGIPGFGNSISIGGPDGPRIIPGPGDGPGMSPPPAFPPVNTPEPQAYNPYVSTMPLYDPSTLGTGLPSTVGATDPYMMYDPYAPVGAFSRPPSESTGFLTEDEIKKGFEDMDRFSLAAQQAKRKAEEEAAKKAAQKNEPKDGGGGGSSPDPGKNSGSKTGSAGPGGAGGRAKGKYK